MQNIEKKNEMKEKMSKKSERKLTVSLVRWTSCNNQILQIAFSHATSFELDES